MGQQQTIYDNYLARWHREHPDVVQPEIMPLAALGPIERIGCYGKYHTLTSCEVYRAADGRVAEMCRTVSDIWRDDAVAVFPSETARQAYKAPEPMMAYLGR